MLNVHLMSFFTLLQQCRMREYLIIFVSPEFLKKSSTDSKYADYHIHGCISLR